MDHLLPEDIERIRKMRASGLTLREIAELTGMSISYVYSVVKDVPVRIGRYRKELSVGLFKGSIVEIETSGPNFDRDELITFGYLMNQKIEVMQRYEASAGEFYEAMKSEIPKLSGPIYGYSANFARDFLAKKVGFDREIIDLSKPFREKAIVKGLKPQWLGLLATVPRQYFEEYVTIGGDIVKLWNRYQESHKMGNLALVVRHNMEDLLRVLWVLAHTELAEEQLV